MSATLKRREVYPGPLVDGRPVSNGSRGRFSRSLQQLLVSKGERDEADVERRIRALPGVTRPNTVALISPKGGVGKTTSTFLVGNLFATHLKLRVIAVDANPTSGRWVVCRRKGVAASGHSLTCSTTLTASRPRHS